MCVKDGQIAGFIGFSESDFEDILSRNVIDISSIKSYEVASKAYYQSIDGSEIQVGLMLKMLQLSTKVSEARLVYDHATLKWLKELALDRMNVIAVDEISKVDSFEEASILLDKLPVESNVYDSINLRRLELATCFLQAYKVYEKVRENNEFQRKIESVMIHFGKKEIASATKFDDVRSIYKKSKFSNELRILAYEKMTELGKVELAKIDDALIALDFYNQLPDNIDLKLMTRERILELIKTLEQADKILNLCRGDRLYGLIYSKLAEIGENELSRASNFDEYERVYTYSDGDLKSKALNEIIDQTESFEMLIGFYNGQILSSEARCNKALNDKIIELGKKAVSRANCSTDTWKIFKLSYHFKQLQDISINKTLKLIDDFSEICNIYRERAALGRYRQMIYKKMDEIGKRELDKANDIYKLRDIIKSALYGSDVQILAVKKISKLWEP